MVTQSLFMVAREHTCMFHWIVSLDRWPKNVSNHPCSFYTNKYTKTTKTRKQWMTPRISTTWFVLGGLSFWRCLGRRHPWSFRVAWISRKCPLMHWERKEIGCIANNFIMCLDFYAKWITRVASLFMHEGVTPLMFCNHMQ